MEKEDTNLTDYHCNPIFSGDMMCVPLSWKYEGNREMVVCEIKRDDISACGFGAYSLEEGIFDGEEIKIGDYIVNASVAHLRVSRMQWEQRLKDKNINTELNNTLPTLPIHEIIGMDKPWPLVDVLKKLIEASEILLNDKSYDGHGWEEIYHCVKRGKEIVELFKCNDK